MPVPARDVASARPMPLLAPVTSAVRGGARSGPRLANGRCGVAPAPEEETLPRGEAGDGGLLSTQLRPSAIHRDRHLVTERPLRERELRDDLGRTAEERAREEVQNAHQMRANVR